ncbi:response regulator transcription factor [Sphingomonas corticis]|jgi:DNA-binding NarL/FixJ family response regulator|uniref:Response regulator transcription factor n=1 Tax=Sphingomonas corticis TaxID=2722791 RepID=A0ABX1CT52_9SPHN|nr:response regulator transcription factor [Sphingomonas corticis]NJR80138.1 response regulator transcription factor [Sphingomonas corticis]
MAGSSILIVDDHPLTREGLSLAARAALPGAVVVGAGSIAEGVAAMANRRRFRLILLDFQLPDAHGYAGMLRLQQIDPAAPIVVVTAHEEPHLIEAAKALGAAGFAFKNMPLDAFADILRRVLAGKSHFPAGVAADTSIAAARARIKDLSKAQYGVLLALSHGHANKRIAHDLSITEATVKAHLTAVFRKIGVTNRAQALLAVRPLLGADGEA